jgi:hypothetical protein
MWLAVKSILRKLSADNMSLKFITVFKILILEKNIWQSRIDNFEKGIYSVFFPFCESIVCRNSDFEDISGKVTKKINPQMAPLDNSSNNMASVMIGTLSFVEGTEKQVSDPPSQDLENGNSNKTNHDSAVFTVNDNSILPQEK